MRESTSWKGGQTTLRVDYSELWCHPRVVKTSNIKSMNTNPRSVSNRVLDIATVLLAQFHFLSKRTRRTLILKK
jgi:hypothetical protein